MNWNELKTNLPPTSKRRQTWFWLSRLRNLPRVLQNVMQLIHWEWTQRTKLVEENQNTAQIFVCDEVANILVSYSIKKYLGKENKQTLITQSLFFNVHFSHQTSNQLRLTCHWWILHVVNSYWHCTNYLLITQAKLTTREWIDKTTDSLINNKKNVQNEWY